MQRLYGLHGLRNDHGRFFIRACLLNCQSDGQGAVLWENGAAFDLSALIAPSALDLMSAEYINDREEIFCVAILPNGANRVVLLVPATLAASEGLTSYAPVPGTVAPAASPRASRRALRQPASVAHPGGPRVRPQVPGRLTTLLAPCRAPGWRRRATRRHERHNTAGAAGSTFAPPAPAVTNHHQKHTPAFCTFAMALGGARDTWRGCLGRLCALYADQPCWRLHCAAL
jgi:hypothetical protein